MARIEMHLVHKNVDDRWHLVESGKSFADFATKDEALAAGEKRGNELHSKGSDAQLIIHRQDGSIEGESSYGHDPRRTPG